MSARPAAVGLLAAAALIALTIVAACSAPAPTPVSAAQPAPQAIAGPAQGLPPWTGLPGMPPVTDPHNVYAEAGAGMLSPAAQAARPLVYVPHTKSRDVWVIDPSSFAVVARYPVGRRELQHVVPSWDMHTLYASDDVGDLLTPF
ncbi:MAG TPA: hypothetical protein VFY38_00395, partial [Pseudonocardia sp.]|nr:hypothetical protein [Pseudonocardia sp.]